MIEEIGLFAKRATQYDSLNTKLTKSTKRLLEIRSRQNNHLKKLLCRKRSDSKVGFVLFVSFVFNLSHSPHFAPESKIDRPANA